MIIYASPLLKIFKSSGRLGSKCPVVMLIEICPDLTHHAVTPEICFLAYISFLCESVSQLQKPATRKPSWESQVPSPTLQNHLSFQSQCPPCCLFQNASACLTSMSASLLSYAVLLLSSELHINTQNLPICIKTLA